MFISAKDVEGCSSKTLKYYKEILENLLHLQLIKECLLNKYKGY